MTGQKKTRRQLLEEFVAQAPGDAFARYGLAMECISTGDNASASQQFHILIEQNANYVPAYLMYGQLLAREFRNEEARQVLSNGISAARRNGDHHAISEMEVLLAELN
jgi:Tfp pilus assembly protein PilF